MAKMDRISAERHLRQWICAQCALEEGELSTQDRLIGGALLDSFAVLALTVTVEEMLDRALSEQESDMNNFVCLEAILQRFFTDETSVPSNESVGIALKK
jgi:acyl carrier protein